MQVDIQLRVLTVRAIDIRDEGSISPNAPGWFETVTSGGGGAADQTGYSLSELNAAYGSESLLYFSIFAGSSTNTGPIFNQLDGIVITLASGDQVRMDLIPEPGSIALGALGAVLLIGHRIIRRKMTTA